MGQNELDIRAGEDFEEAENRRVSRWEQAGVSSTRILSNSLFLVMKRVAFEEPILSPLFPTQPIENAPVAVLRPSQARQCKFTNPYPNFRNGRPVAPEPESGSTSRPAAPECSVGQMCANEAVISGTRHL